MKRKIKITKEKVILILLVLIILSFFYVFITTEIISKHSNSITNNNNNFENSKEELKRDIQVEFCPNNDCVNLFLNEFEKADKNIFCAFYDLENKEIINELNKKSKKNIEVILVIDNEYLDEENLKNIENSNIRIYSDQDRGTKYNNYMHHKFCVIDEKTLITGSTNPTNNGLFKNNNNIIVIESKALSKNYLNEFNSLINNQFGYNKINTLEYPNINLTFENETYEIKTFMCPQNSCDVAIANELDKAKNEVLFATFAITHDGITTRLKEMSKNNITIKGIIEKRNYNIKGSQVSDLINYFEIKNDTNSNSMHHKFFIIDENTVITGSLNPSFSGIYYNDENILVIKNKELAMKYKNEFYKIYSN